MNINAGEHIISTLVFDFGSQCNMRMYRRIESKTELTRRSVQRIFLARAKNFSVDITFYAEFKNKR